MPTPINDLWMKEPLSLFEDRIAANRAKAARLGWRHFHVVMICDPHVLMGVPPEGGEPKRVPDFGAQPTTDRELLLQFLAAYETISAKYLNAITLDQYLREAPRAAEIRDHLNAHSVDYQLLLAKYISHVGECEGAWFIDKESSVHFSADESAALKAAADMAEKLDHERNARKGT